MGTVVMEMHAAYLMSRLDYQLAENTDQCQVVIDREATIVEEDMVIWAQTE